MKRRRTASAGANMDHESKLTVETVRSGGLLRWCANHYLNIGMSDDAARARLQHLPEVVTHASACSGTGTDSESLDKIFQCLQERDVIKDCECLFDCDIEANKRAFIAHYRKLDKDSCQCLFCDIEHLTDPDAPCDVHGHSVAQPPTKRKKPKGKSAKADPKLLGRCIVRRPMFWTCCTSCKYLSPMASNKKDGPANALFSTGTSSHCSMKTYAAHIAFIIDHQPDFVFFDNSDQLVDEGLGEESKQVESNIECVLNDLHCAGYVAHSWDVNSYLYFVPQWRQRVYVIAMLLSSKLHSASTESEGEAVMTEISKRMLAFQRL